MASRMNNSLTTFETSSVPGTPAQSTPEYVLNPLSIYRMARKAVHEKHAPERVRRPVYSGENTTVSAEAQDSSVTSLVERPPAASPSPAPPPGRAGDAGDGTADRIALDLDDLENFFSWDLD